MESGDVWRSERGFLPRFSPLAPLLLHGRSLGAPLAQPSSPRYVHEGDDGIADDAGFFTFEHDGGVGLTADEEDDGDGSGVAGEMGGEGGELEGEGFAVSAGGVVEEVEKEGVLATEHEDVLTGGHTTQGAEGDFAGEGFGGGDGAFFIHDEAFDFDFREHHLSPAGDAAGTLHIF